MTKAIKRKMKKYPAKYLKLSKREIQVLMLICKEYSPPEISKRLKIRGKTFHNHRANILGKIGAKGNVGLVKYVYKHGILTF